MNVSFATSIQHLNVSGRAASSAGPSVVESTITINATADLDDFKMSVQERIDKLAGYRGVSLCGVLFVSGIGKSDKLEPAVTDDVLAGIMQTVLASPVTANNKPVQCVNDAGFLLTVKLHGCSVCLLAADTARLYSRRQRRLSANNHTSLWP